MQVLLHAVPVVLPHTAPVVLLHTAPVVLPHAILSVHHHTVTLLSKCLGNQAKVYAAGNKEPHLFSSAFGVSVSCCKSTISKTGSSLSVRFPGCIQASGAWQAGRVLWARLIRLNGRWSLRCRQQPPATLADPLMTEDVRWVCLLLCGLAAFRGVNIRAS